MSTKVMTASVCGLYVMDTGLVNSGLDGSVFDQLEGFGVLMLIVPVVRAGEERG